MLRFDEAVGAALEAIQAQLRDGSSAVTLVRDVTGQITAVLEDNALEANEWDVLAESLHARLGRFSPGSHRVLLRRSDLIDESDILESPDRVRLPEQKSVWLVDRLLTNLDWLREPRVNRQPLPVATAFSLKGGVGRSTAVAVWAWHLARKGHRVVAVDLDLEAPGLGSLLLSDLPAHGMVDWLVEALLGPPDPRLLDDCLLFSPVAEDAPGVIQVLPAFGANTRDYVAKVGRVYFPAIAPDGRELGLAERIGQLIEELAQRVDPPDVVLLDSRAGLHDIGAAAVTQLGAEVFLFARDEPQSWRAYRLLLEHLSRSKGVRFGMPDEDLRLRLKMVAAQLDRTESAFASWVDASYEVWSSLYDEEGEGAVTFVRDEPSAPHHPLSIYFESGLRGIDLAEAAHRPVWSAIEAAFGDFLAGASARLRLDRKSGDAADGEEP